MSHIPSELFFSTHLFLVSILIQGCFNARLEHTPKPLPTGHNGIPFIVGQGDCLGCAISGCVVISLELSFEVFEYFNGFAIPRLGVLEVATIG